MANGFETLEFDEEMLRDIIDNGEMEESAIAGFLLFLHKMQNKWIG